MREIEWDEMDYGFGVRRVNGWIFANASEPNISSEGECECTVL